MDIDLSKSPEDQGYYFPAEWEKHLATWLSYPHNEKSWPGKIQSIFSSYNQFIKEISKGEEVHINVSDDKMRQRIVDELEEIEVNMNNIFFHFHPTNDAWCRDHGPAFLVNPNASIPKVIVNWKYNAWGSKYPHDLDDFIPHRIAEYLGLPVFTPNLVMEGGSVDFNGKGDIITTESCLLNPNRNPDYNQRQIEDYLYEFYGTENVIWLEDGIIGDDTDGHVDDITRFVNEDTVITMIEHDKTSKNFQPLKRNLEILEKARLNSGKQLNIIEIPMPKPVIYQGEILPASYANFYICNHAVIVPTFCCNNDEKALEILSNCFKDRKTVGIDSTDIIWGLGSFHCLSQQEPL